MLRKYLAVAFCATALASALSGCGSSPTTPLNSQSGDAALTSATIAASTPLVDDGLSGTETQQVAAQSPNTFAAQTAIHPVWFWRVITSDTPTYTFAFSDSDSTGRPRTALVVIHRHLLGTFDVAAGSAGDSTVADTVHVIHKPLDDTWTRRVLLERVRGPVDTTHTFWRIAAISGVDLHTKNGTTHIQSLRVQATGVDTTITDPLAFNWLRRVLRFAPSDSVHLTVTTSRTDDVVLLHHRDLRVRFHNNGDGTYSYAFVTGPYGGWRHFGIDALSHGSVFDDTLPYDANAWRLPFVITSEALVDFYP